MYIFIMIIIMNWWQIGRGISSLTITNLNTIITNLNPNWWWLTVNGKLVAVNGSILYIQSVNNKLGLILTIVFFIFEVKAVSF